LGYERIFAKKNPPENKVVRLPKKNIIHKATKWKKKLNDGSVSSMSEIAKKEGLTRARVTQIMNLLKLPAEMQEFLLKLDGPKEIREFSERKLRNKQKVKSNSMHYKNEL
jgi:hypothetical protein